MPLYFITLQLKKKNYRQKLVKNFTRIHLSTNRYSSHPLLDNHVGQDFQGNIDVDRKIYNVALGKHSVGNKVSMFVVNQKRSQNSHGGQRLDIQWDILEMSFLVVAKQFDSVAPLAPAL